jgi:hypothetical protein
MGTTQLDAFVKGGACPTPTAAFAASVIVSS